MKRVLIFGCSGSGKTTLAQQMGQITGLPVIHLDQHYWQPGWREPDRNDWIARVNQLARGDTWVIDGQYSGALQQRLERADTVIFLDRSRYLCLWRVLKRLVRNLGRNRPELPEGCPEKIDFAFLRYIWTYPANKRPRYLGYVQQCRHTKATYILRSNDEVRTFLTRLPAATEPLMIR
jgi:adenylate kinase family enzyme